MTKELNIKGLSEEVLDLLAGFDIEPYSKVNIELESHMDYINECEEDDENNFEEEIAITDDEDSEEDSFDIGNCSDTFIPVGGIKYDHINVSPIKGLEGLKDKKINLNPLPMLLPTNRRFEEGVVISFPREKCEILDRVEEKYNKALKDIQNEETIEKVNEKKEFVENLIMHNPISIRNAELIANNFIEELEKIAKEEQEINESNDRYLFEDKKDDIQGVYNGFRNVCTNKTLLNKAKKITDQAILDLIETSDESTSNNICLKHIRNMNNILVEFYKVQVLDLKKSIEKEFGSSEILDFIIKQFIDRLDLFNERECYKDEVSKIIYITSQYNSIMSYLNDLTTDLIKEKYELSK